MNSLENDPDPKKQAAPEPEQKLPCANGVYNSCDLFKERTEITICHNGECYRLRLTRKGKLILNK
ncbi:hemin uptake protein HemP [Thalassoglobus sp.]|uniref:hemin uptake protein HemP n=1 Tax=Thalassoglobus sp. TaxID=2795869 RepID=UPI003AA9868F